MERATTSSAGGSRMRVRRARAALVARRSFVVGVGRDSGARSRASDSLERGKDRSTGGNFRDFDDFFDSLLPDLLDLADFPDLADCWDLSDLSDLSEARLSWVGPRGIRACHTLFGNGAAGEALMAVLS